MASNYAWIIDKDHLYTGQDYLTDETGTVGPYNANVATGHDYEREDYAGNKAELTANYQHRHQFRMYDDDQELYYTGTLFWNGEPFPDEEAAYGPLADYGTPNAGAVFIAYTDKPEWDCG